jgi:Zn-dependent alcohol dehydrogenase
MLFKKNAHDLKSTLRIKKNKYQYMSLMVVTTIGATVGFLAGGPFGAAVLTQMGSVAAAQVIEASCVAAIFGLGFIATKAEMDSWTMNQNIVQLR